MEPGNGAGVFTGQSVLFLPARMALMSAMLSFFVRFATDGTVIGGSFGTVSFAAATAMDGVLSPLETGVVDPVTGAGGGVGIAVSAASAFSAAVAVETSGRPPGGTTSSAVVAPASLLAAQPAREATNPSDNSSEANLYRGIEKRRIDEMRVMRRTFGLESPSNTQTEPPMMQKAYTPPAE